MARAAWRRSRKGNLWCESGGYRHTVVPTPNPRRWDLVSHGPAGVRVRMRRFLTVEAAQRAVPAACRELDEQVARGRPAPAAAVEAPIRIAGAAAARIRALAADVPGAGGPERVAEALSWADPDVLAACLAKAAAADS